MAVTMDSAFTTSSPVGHHSDTVSPIFPDRLIHPLPRRRLRSRLNLEAAEPIQYPSTLAPSKPSIGLSFNNTVGGSTLQSYGGKSQLDAEIFRGQNFGFVNGENGFQFKGDELDSDDEEGNYAIRRHQELNQATKPTKQPPIDEETRGGVAKYAKVPLSPAPLSTDSTEGYDSFENTNNKKKRKIPVSGTVGGHHISLATEMAHMGISTDRDIEFSQGEADGGVGQYYGTGSSAVSATNSGTGISGAGRGRYGRAVARISGGRSPLGVSINGSNALHAGRQILQRRDFTPTGVGEKGELESGAESDDELSTCSGHASNVHDQGIISKAIANAATLPYMPSKGKENVSLLEQQASKRSPATKTQFTFTCESNSSRSMPWSEFADRSHLANKEYRHLNAPLVSQSQPVQQTRKDFATQGTQTSPRIANHQNQAQSQSSINQQPAQQSKKPRRTLTKQLALAARQRRLQQEYNNYQHPPSPKDIWICEFCEYESIFGSPPEALVRQYEIKDRQERRRLAEKRRLLEKAKMKGRKGKKANRNAAKSANPGSNQSQTPAQKQRYDPSPEQGPIQHEGTQDEDYLAETDFDDNSVAAPPPIPSRMPSKVPQPIAQRPSQSLRTATEGVQNGGIN
ncbi:MAG: hypothetical protein LQ351_003181 [Letrouitia transgressa]|nr:MAG: hypothetical protein LQ351_003181 [Letrouitia transgressa]